MIPGLKWIADLCLVYSRRVFVLLSSSFPHFATLPLSQLLSELLHFHMIPDLISIVVFLGHRMLAMNTIRTSDIVLRIPGIQACQTFCDFMDSARFALVKKCATVKLSACDQPGG